MIEIAAWSSAGSVFLVLLVGVASLGRGASPQTVAILTIVQAAVAVSAVHLCDMPAREIAAGSMSFLPGISERVTDTRFAGALVALLASIMSAAWLAWMTRAVRTGSEIGHMAVSVTGALVAGVGPVLTWLAYASTMY